MSGPTKLVIAAFAVAALLAFVNIAAYFLKEDKLVMEAPPLPAAALDWPVRAQSLPALAKSPQELTNGVDFSVPIGTQVKAVADGEVIYAGDELAAYGKLILIRHQNDWVSAYGYNSELKAARGESVTRGETVALSGLSPSGSYPSLHFELRRGSVAVDPVPFLASGETLGQLAVETQEMAEVVDVASVTDPNTTGPTQTPGPGQEPNVTLGAVIDPLRAEIDAQEQEGFAAVKLETEMWLGRRYEVSLVIGRGPRAEVQVTDLTEALPGPTPVQASLQIAPRAKAVATSPYMDITPTSPEWQLLSPDVAAVWTWNVQPLDSGTASFRIDLFQGIVFDGGENVVPVKHWPKTIKVNVNAMTKLRRLASLWPMQTMEAISTIIAVFGGLYGGARWGRRYLLARSAKRRLALASVTSMSREPDHTAPAPISGDAKT